MPNKKQPIALIEYKGKKHLTKAEKAAREASEVAPVTDEIAAPSFLTAAQKKHFDKLADQLGKLRVMGETDCETLARYVVAEDLYELHSKQLRVIAKEMPKRKNFPTFDDFAEAFGSYDEHMETVSKRQDRYFKQAQAAARELGLTISARCRLVVPEIPEKPVNKFDRFKAAGER